MRTDLDPPGTTPRARQTGLTLWPISESPAEVLLGTAVGGLDWSDYVMRLQQTDAGATALLALPGTLDAPEPGQVVTIFDAATSPSTTVMNAIVDACDEDEARGSRTVSVTLRRRDGTPLWRDVPRVSPLFGIGMDVGRIAEALAALELVDGEYELPGTGVANGLDGAQLAQLSLWEMLRRALEPALLEPHVDALGKLKAVSRDVRREPDVTLASQQVLRIAKAGSRQAPTTVRVRWTDPQMVEVTQQERVLGTVQRSVGFFSPSQVGDVYWSADRTMRARDTRMEVLRSINDGLEAGLFALTEESYAQVSPFAGRVTAEIAGPNWGTVIGLLVALGGLFLIPDPVATGGVIAQAGATIPSAVSVAKYVPIVYAITTGIRFCSSIGIGEYEIIGTPYDFVHAINETEAYDDSAPAWASRLETIDSAFVPTEDVARSLAVGELIYRSRAASPASLTIADDYRLEPGDLLDTPDGRRFYVQGVSRDLTRGAPAVAELRGMFV